MRDPIYVIKIILSNGFSGFLKIDFGTFTFSVVPKNQATQFESQALARGWVLKAQTTDKVSKYSIVSL